MWSLIAVILFTPIALASNICAPFTARNTTSSKYRVNFFDNGLGFPDFDNVTTLPANISASHNPVRLANIAKGRKGTPFTIGNCSETTQSSCSHGGCYINYETTVQVQHHKHNHNSTCLTLSTTDINANATLSFKPCLGNSSAQLFALSQYVYYAPGYAYITRYGQVDFNLIQLGEMSTPPFKAWYLESDERTIMALVYGYTQRGLGAKLLGV